MTVTTAKIMVARATRYGSTKEVVETVAATLEEQGLKVEAKAAREVHSLNGVGAVLLGTPLYMSAPHKEVRALLARHQAALAQTPLVPFAVLARLPWLSPVATEVFVGKYDPAKLGFEDKMVAALPASPLHGEPAHDGRDWEAIRWWVWEMGVPLRVTPRAC